MGEPLVTQGRLSRGLYPALERRGSAQSQGRGTGHLLHRPVVFELGVGVLAD